MAGHAFRATCQWTPELDSCSNSGVILPEWRHPEGGWDPAVFPRLGKPDRRI